MTTINLKEFFYWYKADEYIEVTDEVAEELRAEDFAGKTRVGLTAGASTPRKLIDATQHWLEQLPE